jgi:AcrR family transcriptional regulator
MPKAAKPNEDEKLYAAILKLAAKGWNSVTVAAVAKAAKIAPAKLAARFAEPRDFIPFLVGEVSRKAFDAASQGSGSDHDRLFDALMARFDILQKNRAAFINIADAARREPHLLGALSRALFEMGYELIDAAGTSPALPRPVVAAGLTSIYAWAFNVWKNDDSRDMAKTMAALDRALRLADKATRFVTSRRD